MTAAKMVFVRFWGKAKHKFGGTWPPDFRGNVHAAIQRGSSALKTGCQCTVRTSFCP